METRALPSPLSRAFWFAPVDARPLALFRIGLGLLLLRDWLGWLPDLVPLFSNDGIFPHGGPLPEFRWSLFSLAPDATGVRVLWAVGLLALIAFTAGFFTRVSTLLAWAFIVSLHNRDILVLTGGDRLVELLLLTSVFTGLGACWSVDAWRSPRPAFAPALGLRFMQLELALMYFFTARLKLRGSVWRSGQGIWVSLQQVGFLRPPGAWLMRLPLLCKVLNDAVMAMEGAFAFLAFSPVARRRTVPLAVLCSVAVQVGILATMRVGNFTWIMLWTNVLFVEPEWLDALRKKATPAAPALGNVGTRQWIAAGVLTAAMALVVWPVLIGSHVRMPMALRAVHRGASLEQPFQLFGEAFPVSRWEAVGTEKDGRTVEILGQTAPGLRPNPGWSFDPWYKLIFTEESLDLPGLGQWICRRYRSVSGATLESLTLLRHSHPPALMGEPPAPDSDVTLWAGRCLPATDKARGR